MLVKGAIGLNELSLFGLKNTRFSVLYSLHVQANFMCKGGLNYAKNNNVNIVSIMSSDLARNTQTIESVYLLLLATNRAFTERAKLIHSSHRRTNYSHKLNDTNHLIPTWVRLYLMTISQTKR